MKMRIPPAPVFLLALLLGAAAAMLVACGDRSGLIPSGDADQLEQHLEAVRSAVADGDCQVTAVNLSRVRSDLDNLREAGIDDRLYRRLNSGVSRLRTRANQECATPTTETTTTPTTTTSTTETETETETETTTTTTPTTTTVPTTTTTVPTTPTTPTTTTPTTPTNPGGVSPDTGGEQEGDAG